MIELILIVLLFVLVFIIFKHLKNKRIKGEKLDNPEGNKPPDDIYPLY
tara:strand:- start:438 stop:581 length:144 start_codon:yes stop_codon:yes gene_type:complete